MIKENTCISIEYNAYTKEDKRLFDTTSEEKAKKAGVYQKEQVYEPVNVIVGKGFVIKGLDESFKQHKVGDKYKITIQPELGFGKWDSRLTENIKLSSFKKQDINPVKGMVINIGGRLGRVSLVIPGRFVKVDYNHPLSGKELIYEVKILKELKKTIDKVKTITDFMLGKDAVVSLKEKKIRVKTKQELPENVKEVVKKIIKETLKKGYNLTFTR
jgi:FKBP-type peptidyl-prolyl cis-trans isomerase 2